MNSIYITCWRTAEALSGQMQTSITRNQYLTLAQKLGQASFDEQRYGVLGGRNVAGEQYDEVYLQELALLPLILKLFYLER